MINVNQITSQLAKMPDQALQKYAALNKNDPYILALAVAESNRRKEMRQAAQGAQGMMPQPKVADQAVQNMAPAAPMGPAGPAQPMPEDMGIGRLPAGDMNFADGGIVAFADGGEVERYNGQYGSLTGDVNRILQKSPFERTPEENALLQQAGVQLQSRTLGPDSGVSGANTFLQSLGPRIRNYFTAGASRLSDEELAAQPGVGGAQNERILRSLGFSPSTAPLGPQASYSNEGRRTAMAGVSALPTDQTKAAPKADQKAPPRPDLAPRAPGTPNAGLPAINDLAAMRANILKQQTFTDPAAKQVEELGKTMVSGAERRQKEFDDFTAKQGDVFKAREERLTKREGELAGMKDKNLGLALLQAGAAMMSTPGNLGMALGKGIDTGSKQYVAGMDKLRAAQERLADARDKMEELRLNRDDMTFKQRSALSADIDRAKVDAQKLGIDGIRLAADVNEKRATDIFTKSVDLQKTLFEQAEATKRAGMPGPQERLFAALGRGDPLITKGFNQYMAATGPEAKGEAALVAQFAKDPVALKMLEQTNPQLALLVKQRMSMMLLPSAVDVPNALP